MLLPADSSIGNWGRVVTSGDTPSWDQLREQASNWLARMDSGTADPEDFEAWRNADPRHATAFAQIVSVTRRLDRTRSALKVDLPRAKPINRRHLMFAGFAVTAGVGGGLAASLTSARASITTRVGQQRVVDLPLGAKMQVNTDSDVQWKEESKLLSVWLKRGEVALHVSDPAQVCKLYGPSSEATFSRGTINARLRGAKILDLAVLAGHCSVSPRSSKPGDGAVVVIGIKQAVVATSSQQVVRSLSDDDMNLISSWPQGELLVQGQPLETVVAEYNRYLSRRILIADPSLSSIRIGGRFTTRDPKIFLEALHDGFGIKVIDDGNGPIVLTGQ